MENNTFDTIIGINVSLKGNLYNKGSIQVNGNIEGEIKSDENLTIGETAVITGPVFANTVEVSGEINGIVEASERLEINPTGRIYGNIKAKTLIVKQGAIFIGKSDMETTTNHKASDKSNNEIKTETKEDTINPASDKTGFFNKK
ncbi:MAG: polymer-forming cytoskeletal protein [bacterium]